MKTLMKALSDTRQWQSISRITYGKTEKVNSCFFTHALSNPWQQISHIRMLDVSGKSLSVFSSSVVKCNLDFYCFHFNSLLVKLSKLFKKPIYWPHIHRLFPFIIIIYSYTHRTWWMRIKLKGLEKKFSMNADLVNLPKTFLSYLLCYRNLLLCSQIHLGKTDAPTY